MRSCRNLVAASFGLVASLGCRPAVPVPAGYEANVEVRDWAAKMQSTRANDGVTVRVDSFDARHLGKANMTILLRGTRLAELAGFLVPSCRRAGTPKPYPVARPWESLVIHIRSGNQLNLTSIDLDKLEEQHGPQVAKHKEEIRKLLLDAYREQEAAKVAERKRYPWKKE